MFLLDIERKQLNVYSNLVATRFGVEKSRTRLFYTV